MSNTTYKPDTLVKILSHSSLSEAAREMDRSINHLYKVLKKNGITPEDKKYKAFFDVPPDPGPRASLIIEMAKSGMTASEISVKAHTTINYVYTVLSRFKIGYRQQRVSHGPYVRGGRYEPYTFNCVVCGAEKTVRIFDSTVVEPKYCNRDCFRNRNKKSVTESSV